MFDNEETVRRDVNLCSVFLFCLLCYILVLILIDTVDPRCGRRLLRGKRAGRYTAGAISDEKAWRIPAESVHAAEINNPFNRAILLRDNATENEY